MIKTLIINSLKILLICLFSSPPSMSHGAAIDWDSEGIQEQVTALAKVIEGTGFLGVNWEEADFAFEKQKGEEAAKVLLQKGMATSLEDMPTRAEEINVFSLVAFACFSGFMEGGPERAALFFIWGKLQEIADSAVSERGLAHSFIGHRDSIEGLEDLTKESSSDNITAAIAALSTILVAEKTKEAAEAES